MDTYSCTRGTAGEIFASFAKMRTLLRQAERNEMQAKVSKEKRIVTEAFRIILESKWRQWNLLRKIRTERKTGELKKINVYET